MKNKEEKLQQLKYYLERLDGEIKDLERMLEHKLKVRENVSKEIETLSN